ncbi:MAG: hypothetical protein AUG51_22245 [Acidobacteria bacterium 13_1_20CM_3_53_8]|nr:MAG: hypothetical protein AUG51_22245 [Acidobacteria bacterium 13_1_20CM_3_53_8]
MCESPLTRTLSAQVLYVTRREAVERFSGRWPNFAVQMTLPHTPLVRIPLTLAAELRRRPVDLLHVQFTAPPFAPCPVVALIPDLAFEHLPETFKRRSRVQLRLTVRRTAQTAAHIITCSDYSRRDIMETYRVEPERITTIPHAAPAHFKPTCPEEVARVRDRYQLEEGYLLAVGSIQPRKNLVRLVHAYENLQHARPHDKLPQLVLVGKHAWLYGETLRAVETSTVRRRVVFTGYVSESDLPGLYTGALGFVYPSYFEGFGLPPLEAMQCGVPVIAGNRTSLPEVVGDAGLLVDPFDEQAIADAIGRVIRDEKLRDELKSKGLERARLFDWRETARRTLEIYEHVGRASIDRAKAVTYST